MKKAFTLGLALDCLILLTGCVNSPSTSETTRDLISGTTEIMTGDAQMNENQVMSGEELGANTTNEYVGLSLEDAQKLAQEKGVEFRIVAQDDEFFPVTADLRPGRVNATVNSGMVTAVEIE